MRQHDWGRLLLAAALTSLVAAAAVAEPASISDAICISCHAEPSSKFHSQPTHKKFTCANCHLGGAQRHTKVSGIRQCLGTTQWVCGWRWHGACDCRC